VLPLGYSFNLDGTMMYCNLAAVFIAQTYHIDMPLATQLAMLATLMITSKGVAACRAPRWCDRSTLSQFGIPEAGCLMIMASTTFSHGPFRHQRHRQLAGDRGRAKWEGELKASTSSGPTTWYRPMRAGDAFRRRIDGSEP